MPITIADSGGSAGASHSLDNSGKVPGSNCVIAVVQIVRRNGATLNGVTYGGVSMTKVEEWDNGYGNFHIALYKLVDAPSGSNNLVVSAGTGGGDIVVGGFVLNGVDEVALVGDTDTYRVPSSTTSISRTLTTTPGGLAISCGTTRTSSTPGSGQTEIFDIVNSLNSAFNFVGSHKDIDSTSTTLSHNYGTTNTVPNMVAVEILAGAGGGAKTQNILNIV